MDLCIYISIISLIIITFYLYTIYMYHTINNQMSYAMPKWIEYLFRPEIRIQCTYDIQELATLLFVAIETLRQNFDIIIDDKVLQYEPHVLLTRYPFFKQVFSFTKFIHKKQCIDAGVIHKVLYDLYGSDMRTSPELHVNRNGVDYFILLKLNEVMDYYDKYVEEGIDNIIS